MTPLYIRSYNRSGDAWTEETVFKRLHQVVTREDAFGLVLEDGGEPAGFAIGCFEQFYDGQVYDLFEILIDGERQNRGLGTALMEELARQVKARGGMSILLQAPDDGQHRRFYEKAGFQDAKNLISKSKILL